MPREEESGARPPCHERHHDHGRPRERSEHSAAWSDAHLERDFPTRDGQVSLTSDPGLLAVAGLQALILLVVVPAVAWAGGLLVLQSARRQLTREAGPQLTLDPSKARILLHLGYSAMPILLGLVLYALARPALA